MLSYVIANYRINLINIIPACSLCSIAIISEFVPLLTTTFFSQVVDTEGVVEEDEEDSGVDSEEVSGVDRDIRLLKGRSLEWGYLYL